MPCTLASCLERYIASIDLKALIIHEKLYYVWYVFIRIPIASWRSWPPIVPYKALLPNTFLSTILAEGYILQKWALTWKISSPDEWTETALFGHVAPGALGLSAEALNPEKVEKMQHTYLCDLSNVGERNTGKGQHSLLRVIHSIFKFRAKQLCSFDIIM